MHSLSRSDPPCVGQKNGQHGLDEAAADRLEAIYLSADVIAQREHTLSLLKIRSGEAVLDIGSGPGFLCAQIGKLVGPTGKVRGIDISPVMVERSNRRNSADWITCAQGDATELPEDDGSYDVVVSTQVAEYVPDVDKFCSEAFRVLKRGGRFVILATDWDAIAWHSDDAERMRAVMAAFVPHCAHSALPRILSPHLRAAGFTLNRVSAYPILNLDWSEEKYSCQMITFIAAYIKRRGTIPDSVLDAWVAEQKGLAARGAYYFLSNRIFFEVSKPT